MVGKNFKFQIVLQTDENEYATLLTKIQVQPSYSLLFQDQDSAQTMDVNFQPLFLKNSPSLIIDQILYLVKNSNLNFDINETPYSLKLNLKTSFAQHWNKPDCTAHNNLPSQPLFPQQDSDPVHQQHHVSVGQPGHFSEQSESQTLRSIKISKPST